jgi:L,D-transpeptidase catalytic domain
MIRHSLFRTAVGLAVVGFLASCAEMPPVPASTTAVAPAPDYAWNGDGVPGAAKIVVHIGEQRAYFFKGKVIVGETTVSTGKPGFSTPPGQYRVVWKNKDHISTRFGDYVDDFGNVVKSNVDSRKDSRPKGSHFDGARMPFAMFFRGGFAMHQGYVPPYAASHGCIRLPNGIAEIFFENAPLGTPVIVKESGSESLSRLRINPESAVVPASTTVLPPPAPRFVRSTAPAPIPPASVRSSVPAPTPVPVRSPAIVIYRPPAPVQSPTPIPVRSSALTPIQPTPPPVRSTAPRSVRSRVPARFPTPSPTPTPTPRR